MTREQLSNFLSTTTSRRTTFKLAALGAVGVGIPVLSKLLSKENFPLAQENLNSEASSSYAAYNPFNEVKFDKNLPEEEVYKQINSILDNMQASPSPYLRGIAGSYYALAHESIQRIGTLQDTASREPVDVQLAMGYDGGKDVPIIGISYDSLLNQERHNQPLSKEDWIVLLCENMEIYTQAKQESRWQDMLNQINDLKYNNPVLNKIWREIGPDYGSEVTIPRYTESWNSFQLSVKSSN